MKGNVRTTARDAEACLRFGKRSVIAGVGFAPVWFLNVILEPEMVQVSQGVWSLLMFADVITIVFGSYCVAIARQTLKHTLTARLQ